MMKKNFVVIGKYYLDYGPDVIGACDTLIGAKRIARKGVWYGDSWSGWQVPDIFRGEDVTYDKFNGRYFLDPNARPVAQGKYLANDKIEWSVYDD